jgi:hemerythrin-like domain-containing protein
MRRYDTSYLFILILIKGENMQSYDIIIKEHDLIIKMFDEVNRTIENATKNHHIDPYIIEKVVDFIRMYADKTHHGKEEDILFKKLKKKNLSIEDSQLMNELIKDHFIFRTNFK